MLVEDNNKQCHSIWRTKIGWLVDFSFIITQSAQLKICYKMSCVQIKLCIVSAICWLFNCLVVQKLNTVPGSWISSWFLLWNGSNGDQWDQSFICKSAVTVRELLSAVAYSSVSRAVNIPPCPVVSDDCWLRYRHKGLYLFTVSPVPHPPPPCTFVLRRIRSSEAPIWP